MASNTVNKSKVSGKALTLLSGGLDSTLCAVLAVRAHGKDNVSAISARYGQKHSREIEAAEKVAAHLEIPFKVIDLPRIFGGGGSTLVEGGPKNPEASYNQISESEGVSPTYVPFRNGNLLSAAAAVALVDGAEYIYYGAHAEDARSWAYPDCTPEFNGAMANAIYVGTYHKVRLVTPLQNLEKHQIVDMSWRLNSPIELTYSCYNGRERHCGTCPTCIGRIQAFAVSGFADRVPYEIEIDWEKLTRELFYGTTI